MKYLIMLATFLSVTLNAEAKDANGISMIWGAETCGQMVQDSQDTNQATVDKMYLQGVSAGINAAVPGKADFFENTDIESRYQFVLKYCKDNPLKNMWNGIDELVKELTGKTTGQLVPDNPKKTSRRM